MKSNKKLVSVGLICTSLDQMAGGLERQIIRTCQSFLEQGFKVFLFTFDNEKAIPFYKLPEKIVWIRCGKGLDPHSSAPIYLRFKLLKSSEIKITRLLLTLFAHITAQTMSRSSIEKDNFLYIILDN